MAGRASELMRELADNYADRLDDEQVDYIDELLADEDWAGAILKLVQYLEESRALVSGEELGDLEELCEAYDVEADVLEELEIM